MAYNARHPLSPHMLPEVMDTRLLPYIIAVEYSPTRT